MDDRGTAARQPRAHRVLLGRHERVDECVVSAGARTGVAVHCVHRTHRHGSVGDSRRADRTRSADPRPGSTNAPASTLRPSTWRPTSNQSNGVEHASPTSTAALLASGSFERVLGSLHSTEVGGETRLIDEWHAHEVTAEHDASAGRDYLAEAIRLVEESDVFEVFAHIDYVTRQIDRSGRRHNPVDFEDEYRETLRAVQQADRILEINTRQPLDEVILRWWHDEGGAAVSFGSDAHEGGRVGHGFADAAAMAETAGFRRQADPLDFWRR